MIGSDKVKKRMEVMEKRRNTVNNSLASLKLSDNQREEFKKINSKHSDLVFASNKQMKRMKLQLELEKMNEKLDMLIINELINEIASIQASITKSNLKRDVEIRSILSEKQIVMYEKLKQRKKNMVKQEMKK